MNIGPWKADKPPIFYGRGYEVTNKQRTNWEVAVRDNLAQLDPGRARAITGDSMRHRLDEMYQLGVSPKRAVFGLMPGAESVSNNLVDLVIKEFIADYGINGSCYQFKETYAEKKKYLEIFLLYKTVNFSWLSFHLNVSEKAMNHAIENNYL